MGNYAKYMILLARTNQTTERKYDGLSFFLAPMTVSGVEMSKIENFISCVLGLSKGEKLLTLAKLLDEKYE